MEGPPGKDRVKKEDIVMIKFLYVMLALALVLSATVSSAMSISFTIVVDCSNPGAPLATIPLGWYSGDHSGRMYIRYSILGLQDTYTTLFHVMDEKGRSASKWITPNIQTPIESYMIVPNTYYGLAVRGNTRYFEMYGITSYTIIGTYGWYY